MMTFLIYPLYLIYRVYKTVRRLPESLRSFRTTFLMYLDYRDMCKEQRAKPKSYFGQTLTKYYPMKGCSPRYAHLEA